VKRAAQGWTVKSVWQRYGLLPVLLALALAARLAQLTSQSFWYDEGWTSWAVNQSWRGMMDLLAQDNHPPLYFAVLKLWAAIFGRGDVALRGFSLLADLGMVALLYALGRRLWNTGVGALAALCASISPPLVMYAQEARMYSLVTALVVAATYCLAGLPDERPTMRRRWAGLYAVCMAAALYSHHVAWLAFGAHAVVLLILAARRRDWLPLVAGVLVVVLYLPQVPLTLQQIAVARGMSWKPHVSVSFMLTDLWLFLNLGWADGRRFLDPAAWGGLALAAAGLGLGWRLGRGCWMLLILGLAVPTLTACVAQMHMPFYIDRYLLYLAPFYCLLMALGAWALFTLLPARVRRRAWLGLVLLFALLFTPMVWALGRYYTGRGPLKADFRSVARYLEDVADQGDALALVQAAPPLLHYYRGGLPWRAFPEVSVTDYVTDEQEVARKLREIARPGATIWCVGSDLSQTDPQNLVEAHLREHCEFVEERWWQTEPRQPPIRVAAYVVQDIDFAPLPRTPLTVDFGAVELVAYGLQQDSAGNLYVSFWWHTLAQPERDYNVFVHLIDVDGNTLAQGDHAPLNVYHPMHRWQPGQTWRDEHKLSLPEETSLEDLRLRIGLSWGSRGQKQLPIVGGPWAGQSHFIIAAQDGA